MSQYSIEQKQIPERLYRQVVNLSNEVRNAFRKKGIAVPSKTKEGIRLGRFTVVQENTGFYYIKDFKGEVWYKNINLQQSAILVANDLELGRFVKTEILKLDSQYGWASFEEDYHKKSVARLKIKNPDQSDIRSAKHKINLSKKNLYKAEIARHFKKLCNLI